MTEFKHKISAEYYALADRPNYDWQRSADTVVEPWQLFVEAFENLTGTVSILRTRINCQTIFNMM
jgi:hypothetical protein